MKKLFSLVAVAAMVSFAACSNNKTEEGAATDSTNVEMAPPVENPEPVAPTTPDTNTTDTATAPQTTTTPEAH